MTTGGLVGAKLVAAVAVFVLLFVASLPCLGVQLFLVGVSSGEIFAFIAVTLSTIIMGASIGILCAMVFRRPATALTMSYIGTAFALGGWFLIILIPAIAVAVLFFDGDLNACLNALPAGHLLNHVLEAGMDGYRYTLSGGRVMANRLWDGTAYRLVIAALCVLVAIRMGRRSTAPAAPRALKLIDEPAVLRARQRRFPFYLIDPLRRWPLMPDGVNPVLMREWRQSLGRRSRVAMPAFILTAFVLAGINIGIAWATANMQWVYEDTLRVVLILEIVGVLLVVQVLSAGAFAREREQMGTDFLRTSLLSSSSIFWGRFWGGALAALPYLAGAAAAIPFGVGKLPMLLGGFATLATCVWLTLCISYFVSGFVKSTAAALGAGVMTNLFVYLWPALGMASCDSLRWWSGHVSCIRLFEQLSPLIAFSAYRWKEVNFSGRGEPLALSIESDLYVVLAVFAAIGFLLVANAKWRFESGGLRR